LKYLVSQGADVNAKNKNGWTPRFFAIEKYGNQSENSIYLKSVGGQVGGSCFIFLLPFLFLCFLIILIGRLIYFSFW
jgi:hypothetical protein